MSYVLRDATNWVPFKSHQKTYTRTSFIIYIDFLNCKTCKNGSGFERQTGLSSGKKLPVFLKTYILITHALDDSI